MESGKKSGSIVHLGAGALSGITACVLLQPFDLVKTRVQQSQAQIALNPHKSSIIQTVQSVVKQDGIRGLWRGTVPTLIRNAPGTSLYFFFLNHMRNICLSMEQQIRKRGPAQDQHQSNANRLSNTSNMIVGATSRMIAGFMLMPGTVLKVQYESSLYKYTSIGSAVNDIWKANGVRGFFVGAVPTAIRDAPYAGIYMLLYEWVKNKERSIARSYFDKELPETTVTLVSGVLSGLCASYITQPFDLVKTRMQIRPKEYTSITNSFIKIAKEESILGFFRGISLRVMRKGIQASLVFTLYEWVLRTNAKSEEKSSVELRQ